jgi:hypothetical protein
LSAILDDFNEALDVLEVTWRALDAVEEVPGTVKPYAANLRQGIVLMTTARNRLVVGLGRCVSASVTSGVRK